MAVAIPLIAGAVAGGAGYAAAGAGVLGAAATAAPLTSALGIGGLTTSALGSIAQGQQQAASAKYNASVAANNAQIATQNANLIGAEGNANAGVEGQKTRANVGAIKASQAANGIDINSGSAVDVRSSAAELGELNAINIRSQAARAAYGQQTQAASDTAQAALDKQQAGYAAEAGVTQGATTLLSGYGKGIQSGQFADPWAEHISNNGGLNGGVDYTNSFAPVG